jgi:hypothetical protein
MSHIIRVVVILACAYAGSALAAAQFKQLPDDDSVLSIPLD